MSPVATDDTEDTTTDDDLTEHPEDAFGEEFESAATTAVDDESPGDEPTLALREEDEPLDDGEPLAEDEEEQQEGEPRAEARPGHGKEADRGDGRNDRGEFVAKTEQAAAGVPVAGAAAQPAAAAPAPVWDRYQVRAEQETVPIEGVQVQRTNGWAMLAMPEKELGRFNALLGRGYLAEKFWRNLKAERQAFDFERSAPPRKSDTEIEAEILAAALEPHLADFLSDDQIANLKLRIELAKREEADKYSASEQQRRTKHDEDARVAEERAGEPQAALDWMRREFLHVLGSPEFGMGQHNFSEKDVVEVFDRLVPYVNSVIYKDGADWFSRRDLIVRELRAKAAGRSAASAPAAAPAGARPAPSAGNARPRNASASAGKPDAATQAERFNKAQNSADRTTSVKANRGKGGSRPRAGSPGRTTREQPRRSKAERAEDNWNATKKGFLRSNSLDFDEPDDDES